MPPSSKLEVTPPSLVKRVCGALGCGAVVRGCDLPRHYKSKTNFEDLRELKEMASDAADERVKGRRRTVCLILKKIWLMVLIQTVN